MKDSEKLPDLSGVHVWLVLMKAFRAVAGYVEPKLRESGLGESDFRILEVLLHKGPLPVNTIGPIVRLTTGSISTAVDRLFEKGLVSRVDSEADRRVKIVALTAKGRKLIGCVFNAHAAQMENLMRVLTAAERVQLLNALKKVGKEAARRR
jgi:MarR family 2-MHQ and catechol resistance regulon transcriptional repressor